MSPEPPPTPDTLKETTEKLANFVQWILDLIQRRNWFTLLLLVNVAWGFFGNPGVVGSVYKAATNRDLPAGYVGFFWLILGLIFVVALGVAIATMPRPVKLDLTDTGNRRAIKGLRSFGPEDAEIFAQLQRNQSLEDCLASISRPEFRFGILVGESGCGKTSLLQAGLMPRLRQPDARFRGVYVKFSDRPPLATIAAALVEQLPIAAEQLAQADFLAMLQQALVVAEKPVVLIFDQFEQFFTHQPRRDDRQPFFQALTTWYGAPEPLAVKILVSIRADLQYELNQLQQALGYTLSRYEIFQLEPFEPQEAMAVLRVLAETEQLGFDRNFVEDLTQRELKTVSGKVSPVDVQIVAEMVRKQKQPEQRAFSRTAFQRLGGMEGLLNRYLEETLQTLRLQGHQSLYQTTIQVLLALTDRERLVRAGVQSMATLQTTLQGLAGPGEVVTAVNWLASGEVRLLTPVEQNQEAGYELAHERLIPALLRLAGKELKETERANQLLERRVNEWLGNQRRRRYLLSLRELWLIRRYRSQLTWGANCRQKEALIQQSWRVWRQGLWAGLAMVLLVLLGWLGWLTPLFQQWHLKQQLASLSLSRSIQSDFRVEAATALAMNRSWNPAQAVMRDLGATDPVHAGYAWSRAAEIALVLQETDRAKEMLVQARTSANQIKYDSDKVAALSAIAAAYGQLQDTAITKDVLTQARASADQIQDDSNRAKALSAIAAAYGQLQDPTIAKDVLAQARSSADQIQYLGSRSHVLQEIVQNQCEIVDRFQHQKQLANTTTLMAEAKRTIEVIQDLQDSSSDRGYRTQALEALVAVRIKHEGWRQANQTIGLCTSNDCRITVAAKALSTWAEIQSPELAKWRQEKEKEKQEAF